MPEEYSIKKAAELLDVSNSTVRRRIKEGKIEAEKRETTYGEKYFIPADQFEDMATIENEVIEVKEIESKVSIKEFKNDLLKSLEGMINEEKEEIIESVNEVGTTLEKQQEIIEEQQETLKEFQEELQKKEERLKEIEKQSFWERIRNLFG